MIQLSNLDVKIPKNYVLVEVIDDSQILKTGSLEVKVGKTKDGVKFNEGEHSVRRGYLIKLPDRVTYDEAGIPWKNPVVPKIGNIVYFDYLTGFSCDKAILKNKIYYILPYRSLILQVNPNMNTNTIEMLNGFILAQYIPKTKESDLEVIQKYYRDRYTVKRAGKPNTEYKDENVVDDPLIQEGTKIITQFENYPVLEADYQLHLDGESYIYFQRNAAIGIIN